MFSFHYFNSNENRVTKVSVNEGVQKLKLIQICIQRK